MKVASIFAMIVVICSMPVAAVTVSTTWYQINFNQSSYTVDHNAGMAVLNLTLNKTYVDDDQYNRIQIYYNTRNGTANNVTDFQSPVNATYWVTMDPIHSAIFQKGDLYKLIYVPILNDNKFSWPDKYFYMQLTDLCPPDVTAVLGDDNNATITIHETNPAPTVQFNESLYTVGENDGYVQVRITMTGTPLSEGTSIPVSYTTIDGTGVAGTDYATTAGTVTFTADGPSYYTFNVPVMSSMYSSPNKTFSVHLSSVAPVTLGSDATVKIIESSYVVHVNNGWSLVSWPIVNNTIKASDLTDNSSLGVTIVAIFDPATQTFKSYTRGDPSIFDFTLSNDIGIFLWGDHSDGFPVYGQLSTPHDITLYPQWNLIGWSSLSKVQASEITSGYSNVEIIARYDVPKQAYQSYTAGDPSVFDFTIGDGEGYFIYSTGSEPGEFLTGGIRE